MTRRVKFAGLVVVAGVTPPIVGMTVVECPGCHRDRWHGTGPCRCGAPGTAEATS